MGIVQILGDEAGQGVVEYGLILALISIAAIAVLLLMGPKIEGMYNAANEELLKVPG